jgi:predicted glycoside hydrolase/deacetylase ChbG (UPF0249 family)
LEYWPPGCPAWSGSCGRRPLDSHAKTSLIANADDLGWSDGVNRGIFRAHAEGILTSTTLAANMPAAASAVGRLGEFPRLGVGVHLNACQGPPLSNLGRDVLAGGEPAMNFTATALIRRCLLKRYETVLAVQDEFEAQIRWCLEHGLRPTHADTHRHLHAWPPIFRVVVTLCRRYHIPFIRRHRDFPLTGNAPPAPAKERRLSKALDMFGWWNRRQGRELLATEGTIGVAYTGHADEAFLLAAAASLPPGVTELMVHPGYPDDLDRRQTRLLESRRVEMEALCSPRVRELIEQRGIVLTHYGKLRTEND